MAQRPGLAALIVAQKLASAREVERAMKARGDAPLWRKIVDAGVITEPQIFELLRDESKIPVVTEKALAHAAVPDLLHRLLPRDEAMRLGILPIDLTTDGRRVQMAMIDPTDETSLRMLARGAGFESAKVFLIARAPFDAAIDRLYKRARATVEPAGKVGQRSDQEEAERFEQVLVQAAMGLGGALEVELSRGRSSAGGSARGAARLAREVARELGLDRRRVALAGLCTLLVRLDAIRRTDEEPSLFESVASEVGWAGGGEDGLLGIGRALTARAAGFGRSGSGASLQRVVQVVTDFHALDGADGEPARLDANGLDAVDQLLRTSNAGSAVVDALMHVLRRDLADRTPAAATMLPESHSQPSAVTKIRSARNPTVDAVGHAVSHDDRTQLVALPGASTTGTGRES